MVTAGGIQTPILKPEELQSAAETIFEALDDRKLDQGNYNGYLASNLATCAPVGFEQMAPTATTSQNIYGDSFEAGLTSPNTDEFVELRERYGFDLEYNLISEIKDKDLIPLEQIKKDNQSSIKSIYRGGCLGDTPYVSFPSRESKAFSYSSPDIECAKIYSGAEGGYGVKLKATSSNKEDTKNFGLIYEFEASKNTMLYGDYNLENGQQPVISAKSSGIASTKWSGKNLETVVTSENKLKNIYIHIKKDSKDMLYPIPLKDKKWKAFLALYRSSDVCLRGYMIDRRQKILDEKKVYSSLNNQKKFGIFKTKVKPIDWKVLNKEKAIKAANLTIEEKNVSFSKENIKTSNLSKHKDVAKRISELRLSKSTTNSTKTQSKQKTLSEAVIKFANANKRGYS